MNINKLRTYLEWLITPQNEEEQKKFKEENLVDDYIGLKNRINDLSEDELIKEINIQLAPYNFEINK